LSPSVSNAAPNIFTNWGRATAELLAELGNRIGGMPAIIGLLTEYERLTPEVLRATGGDRFPRRIRAVPR
jgi:hypothetical protein